MRRVVLAAVLLCAAAVPVVAQDAPPPETPYSQGPVRLAPPKALQPPSDAGPSSLEPSDSSTTGEKPPRAFAPASVGEAVEVGSLQAINADSAGVLSAEQGGFGASMWSGTNRQLVNVLLPRLPVNTASPAMRGLMRRLLLSAATPPRGEADGVSLVALRIKLLADMGDIVGVNQLLNATPGRNQNEQLMRIEADVRFLANDNARACALAAGQISADGNDYWQKAFIFCQALAGEKEKAFLGLSLLRELGDEDVVFLDLIESLISGDKATIKSLPNPTPLHLAMARVARASMPADVISSNQPSILGAIAVSPNASVELRLDAAERAEATGALPVDTLRQLYTSVSFSEEDMANPLSKAEAESGPLSRALLYRTALIQTVPTAQAEALARALSLARQGGRYASTARVFMPVIKRIPPSAELIWFAPEAVRSLIVAGESEASSAWFALLRASAMFNKNSAVTLKALMPVAYLAGSAEAEGWSTDDLAAWWKTEKKKDGARERAVLLFSLFEALGESVPSLAWDELVGGPERTTVVMPQPALWYRLEKAAEAATEAAAEAAAFGATDEAVKAAPDRRERLGETVLLSLLALGEGGPGQADSVVLKRVMTSLRTAGLEAEARALAVEAALSVAL